MHTFRYRILVPVVLAWLVLTIIGVGIRTTLWDRLAGNVDNSFEAARFSHALDTLFSSLQEAESAQRMFLLTGKESYLEPFNRLDKALAGQFSELAAMASKDQYLRTNLLEMRSLVSLKMSEFKDTIRLRRANDTARATAIVNSGKGQETMNQLGEVVGLMRARGALLFAESGIAARTLLAETHFWGLGVGFLAIGAGLLALYLLRVSYLQEQARQILTQDKSIAEKLAGEKGAFLANISHEIRTPMNSILGFSELLEDEALTPRQARYVRSIRQSGKSLLQLVTDVLDLSRLEAGKVELRREPADLRELCNSLQMMFGQQATAKSLKLIFETDDGIPAGLFLDRVRIQQVMVNLISNAVKFTAHGHVRTRIEWVRTAGSKGTLLIDVEDTGKGIEIDKHQEIFKPFTQLGPSTADAQGTGLGLTIVQRLTEAMGGTVSVDSAPGRGSVFRLRFPEVAASSRLPEKRTGEDLEVVDFNDFSPASFLVVDDNEANRSLIAGILAETRHTVQLAASGKEALERIAERRPAVVLLDIRMPALDGLAVLKSIRKMANLESLPVVALTASGGDMDDASLTSHFNGLIRKPFSRRTLYNELARILPRKASRGVLLPDKGRNQDGAFVFMGSMRRTDNWPVLVAQLRRMLGSEWENLRESLAINQTQAFAQKLRGLAEAMQCERLAAYADALASQAEAYAVRDLEKQLAEFPALVESIEEAPSMA